METEANGTGTTIETRRRRTSKKRLKFGPPQSFPRGVRELWTSATREEQARAHQACTQILALWLGRRRRAEVAEDLSIPPLRVWQLSQQALSGMLAGLLHQPRPRRRRQEDAMEQREDDPRTLKKRLAEKDKQIADQQELIRLLTSIPKPRDETSAREAPTPERKTRGPRAAKKREDGGGEIPLDASAPPR
jgi:hypothetical protein